MPQKTGLLEYLASVAGCSFLSDLHSVNQSQRDILAALIRTIHPQEYSLRQWNDALEYLAQKKPLAASPEARAAILQHLTDRAETIKPRETVF